MPFLTFAGDRRWQWIRVRYTYWFAHSLVDGSVATINPGTAGSKIAIVDPARLDISIVPA